MKFKKNIKKNLVDIFFGYANLNDLFCLVFYQTHISKHLKSISMQRELITNIYNLLNSVKMMSLFYLSTRNE